MKRGPAVKVETCKSANTRASVFSFTLASSIRPSVFFIRHAVRASRENYRHFFGGKCEKGPGVYEAFEYGLDAGVLIWLAVPYIRSRRNL